MGVEHVPPADDAAAVGDLDGAGPAGVEVGQGGEDPGGTAGTGSGAVALTR